MKRKLLDRRGVAVELAILMMVVSFSVSILLTGVALIQSTKKARVQAQLQERIVLEQLGQDFLDAVANDDTENWSRGEYAGFKLEYKCIEFGKEKPEHTLMVYKKEASEDGPVLKITLTYDEQTESYKITEWTKE